jgi:hypothetical protein
MTIPTRVQNPAIDPMEIAIAWYIPSVTPTAAVHDSGTPRPITWPRKTNSRPKWKSGLPQRSSRSS